MTEGDTYLAVIDTDRIFQFSSPDKIFLQFIFPGLIMTHNLWLIGIRILFSALLAATIALSLLFTSCGEGKQGKNEVTESADMALNESFPAAKADEAWKSQLTEEQYEIMVKKGTEAPFENEFYNQSTKSNHK